MATCDFTNSVQGIHQGLIYTESTDESRIVGFANVTVLKTKMLLGIVV